MEMRRIIRSNALKLSITVGAGLLIIGHLVWPNVTIDTVTLVLLIIAVLPWFSSLLKSVEIPGGWKVEFQDVQTAGEKITTANPPPEPRSSTERPSYVDIADRDPNLALVGLGIEIEKRLLALADKNGIDARGRSMRLLLGELMSNGVLNDPSVSGLQELIMARNQAAHGAKVDPTVTAWALNEGPDILAVLDAKLAQ